MKFIEKETVTPVDDKAGAIYNTTNIENKDKNTYSAEIIDGLVKKVYSGIEEQVVGKWINGKPIYRRVINTATPNTSGNYTVVAGVNYIDTLVKLDGLIHSTSTYSINCDLNNDTHKSFCYFNRGGEEIRMQVGSSFYSVPVILILEYTKKTDKANVMINFTVNCSATNIGNKTYQAEYGMTWKQWINSEYNVDGYYADGSDIRLNANYYISSSLITDIIQANTTYNTSKGK